MFFKLFNKYSTRFLSGPKNNQKIDKKIRHKQKKAAKLKNLFKRKAIINKVIIIMDTFSNFEIVRYCIKGILLKKTFSFEFGIISSGLFILSPLSFSVEKFLLKIIILFFLVLYLGNKKMIKKKVFSFKMKISFNLKKKINTNPFLINLNVPLKIPKLKYRVLITVFNFLKNKKILKFFFICLLINK